MSSAAGFVAVGQLRDFPPGKARVVTLGGERVAVFHVGGRLVALQDNCPHMGASLAAGHVAAGRVTCHWHGWSFDLDSGECDRKAWACARVYDVRVEDQTVLLRRGPDPRVVTPPEEDDWVPFDPAKHLRRKKDE